MIKPAGLCALVFVVILSIAAPQPAVAATASQNDAVIHIVQPGENLFRIRCATA